MHAGIVISQRVCTKPHSHIMYQTLGEKNTHTLIQLLIVYPQRTLIQKKCGTKAYLVGINTITASASRNSPGLVVG